MIKIEEIKKEIVEELKPLKPDKILLFGSYAYGNADEDSDIDLFLIKNIKTEKLKEYQIQAKLNLSDLTYKYKTGFDVLVATEEFINNREDYFYKNDIIKKSKVLYEQNKC